jgi:hypothetical protein
LPRVSQADRSPEAFRDHSTGFAAEVLFQYRESPETAQAQISDNPDLIVSQDGLRYIDESGQLGRK